MLLSKKTSDIARPAKRKLADGAHNNTVQKDEQHREAYEARGAARPKKLKLMAHTTPLPEKMSDAAMKFSASR
jgi:hypothetical protein